MCVYVVILSLLYSVGLCFFPAWRAVVATVFVLMWSAALLPLDYQVGILCFRV